MLHKGNISNIHICPEDVVDCVIGGSPCQDLSVAGLRKGIKHESKGDEETTRSGLFMEQIRIIKEMRDVDKRAGRTGVDIRPRWAVWENVPGALSSGKPKGEDFRIVLEEFAKIADPAVAIPGPPRGGWQPAGCIVGDGFSIAWRIMDARYHGVPQRRRRIALVCDFAADGAPAVLFDEEGMRWDFETSQRAWKGIAPYFAGYAAGSDRTGLGGDRGVEQSEGPGVDLYNARLTGETANTLNANTGLSANHAGPAVCQPIAFKERAGKPGGEKGILCDEDGSCFTLSAHQGDGWSEEQVGYTLNSVERHGVAYAIDGNVCDRVSAKNGCGYSKDVSPTLNTQDRHAVVYDARGNGDGETVQTLTGDHSRTVSDYTPLVCSINGRACTMNEEISGTLQAKPTGGQSLNCINPVCIEKTHYEEKSYGEYSEGTGTLKASGGSAGNGSETLVCEPASVYWDGGQVANTLTKKGMDQRMPDKGQFQCVLQPKHRKYIVRRLTPLECSRLQGMPDDWCDIKPMTVKAGNSGWGKKLLDKLLKTLFKKADYEAEIATKSAVDWWRPILDEWAKINGKKPKSDAQIVKWLSSPVSESAQYQMYGNGIALPQWVWVCGRIIEAYGEHKPTMASLFDGTGSFPLIWNSILGGAYTAWSSEVNPDAIRVSKYRMEERGW